VRYQADQEQDDKDEEADSGDLSRRKSHNSKTEEARHQSDHNEDQRIVQYGDFFLFTGA